MSVLGHELRRPLTVIRGAATLLLQSYDQMPRESTLEMLRLIDRNVEDMSDLIEDILMVAHVDSGDLRLASDPVDLGAVLEGVAASERIAVRAESGLAVRGDRGRLRQVLRALIGNALRYSPPDSLVEVAASRQGDQVTVEVLDRGPGLSEQDLERAFQRFRRVDDVGPGTGSGLYLARGLIEAMGGRLGFRPRPDGGSLFWFTLSLDG